MTRGGKRLGAGRPAKPKNEQAKRYTLGFMNGKLKMLETS